MKGSLRRAHMKIILDGLHDPTDERLTFAAQIGVEGVSIAAPDLGDPARGYYEFADLVNLRTRIESFGLKVFAIQNVPWKWNYKIMLGLPGRDEQIENLTKTIRNMGAASIPIFGYNFHAMRFYRTSRSHRVRGGALATSFDMDLVRNAPIMAAGPGVDINLIPPSYRRPISDEEMWDNFTYFIKAVVPVAEQAGVKLAIHPDDPPVPAIGGVSRIMRHPSAFKRVIETIPSDYNGLLFCQGCYTEMGVDVIETIRYFGSRKKLFWVHFRNVVGTTEKFHETFPDDGKVDMHEAMKTYKEVGFDGIMSPDHTVHLAGDTDWGHRYWAYAIGYMKALKQAVEQVR
jgi:mannonate dehydratase